MFILCQRCLNIKLVIFGVMSVMVGVEAFYWVKRPLWADEVGTFDHAIFVWSFIAFHPWNKSSHKMVAPPTEYYFCKSVYFIIHSFYICFICVTRIRRKIAVLAVRDLVMVFHFLPFSFLYKFSSVWRTCAFWFPFAEWLKFVFWYFGLKWLFRSIVFRISGIFNSFLLLFHIVLLAICMLYVSRGTVLIAPSFLG